MCNNEYCTGIALQVMALRIENDTKIAVMRSRGCSDLEIAEANAEFLRKVIKINGELLKRCAVCKDQRPEITKLGKDVMDTANELIDVYDTVAKI